MERYKNIFKEEEINLNNTRYIFYYKEKDIKPYLSKFDEVLKIKNIKDVTNYFNVKKINDFDNSDKFNNIENESNKKILLHFLPNSKNDNFFASVIQHLKNITISIPCTVKVIKNIIMFEKNYFGFQNEEQIAKNKFLHLEPKIIEGKTINKKLKNLELEKYEVDISVKSTSPNMIILN